MPAGNPLGLVAADLAALEKVPDATLLAANTALVRFLPLQLNHLRAALDAKPVTIASIPAAISRDWLLPDGRARLQVTPKAAANGSAGLRAFVRQVTVAVPEASGSAVSIIASADTIIGAFRDAAWGRSS